MARRPVLATLLAALVLLTGAPAASAATDDPVRSHLEEVMDEEDVPGLAVAVVPLDGEARTWTLGEDGDGREVDRSTPFVLGSVAKTFTSAVVHDLVDRGALTLEDTLGERLPDHGIADDRADEITVEELLTHTSGLTGVDGLAHAERFDTEPGAIRRQATGLGDVSLARAPGEGYEYSSLNYLLLGAVVEEAGGAPFASQVDRVARNAGTDLITSPTAAETIPPGHRQIFGRSVAFDSPWDSSGTPYGYLGSDLDGLTAWAHAQVGGDRGHDKEALRDMHTGHVETGSGGRYGHGWSVGETDGETTVQHTGATPGYFTHVLLLPERDVAVVVMANGYSEAHALTLGEIAPDVARIEDGAEPVGADDDRVLGAAPFVVAGTALLGVIVTITLLGARRRTRCLAIAGAVVLVPAALLAPGLLGTTSEVLRLWAPDVGWGLWAAAGTWTLAGVVAVLGLLRSPRSADLDPHEGSLPTSTGAREHEHGLAAVQVGDCPQDGVVDGR